jgi:hypothetical protein
MTVGGIQYDFGMADLFRGKRVLDYVKPGTTMTAADLRVYYAVNFVQTNFPKNPFDKYCATYKAFKAFFDGKTDAYMFGMVTLQESKGYDVPDKGTGVPPPPIC